MLHGRARDGRRHASATRMYSMTHYRRLLSVGPIVRPSGTSKQTHKYGTTYSMTFQLEAATCENVSGKFRPNNERNMRINRNIVSTKCPRNRRWSSYIAGEPVLLSTPHSPVSTVHPKFKLFSFIFPVISLVLPVRCSHSSYNIVWRVAGQLYIRNGQFYSANRDV